MSGHNSDDEVHVQEKPKSPKPLTLEVTVFDELLKTALEEVRFVARKFSHTNVEDIETKQKLLTYVQGCLTLVKDLEKLKGGSKDKSEKKCKDKDESKDKREKKCKDKDESKEEKLKEKDK